MSIPGKVVEWLMARYPDQATEVAMRYLPIVRILRSAGVRKVLEVGSGDLGIAPYGRGFELTGLDIAFERESPAMEQVTGSATSLPFPDHSFDAVISVDSLEHLAPGQREDAVVEIVRTAVRMAVIAFPSGPLAEEQDRELDERYVRVFGEEFPFFKEHIEYGLPDRGDLERMVGRALKGTGRRGRVTIYDNSNLLIRSWLMKGWISKSKFWKNLAVMGMRPLAGLLSRLTFGACYRVILVVDFD